MGFDDNAITYLLLLHGSTDSESELAKHLSIEVECLRGVMKKMIGHLSDVSVVAIAVPRDGGEMVIGL